MEGRTDMSLYANWNAILEGQGLDAAQTDEFWNAYLNQEKDIYDQLLSHKETELKTTVKAFGERFDLDPTLVVGFLDGINDSLESPLDLESLEEETEIDIKMDLEKLYLNMHKAKAEWLFKLPAWDELLSKDKQREIKREYGDSVTVRVENKIGRNDPCPCGSGKKYKKCCIDKEIAQ